MKQKYAGRRRLSCAAWRKSVIPVCMLMVSLVFSGCSMSWDPAAGASTGTSGVQDSADGAGSAADREEGQEKGGAVLVPGYKINAAVVYDSSHAEDESWKQTLSYLQQSLYVNMTGEAVDLAGYSDAEDPEFPEEYDILYLDSSVSESFGGDRSGKDSNASWWIEAMEQYVRNGGTVVLDNDLGPLVPEDFSGLSDFGLVEECPANLEEKDSAAAGEDLGRIRDVILMYSSLFPEFSHYEDVLSNEDYGLDAQAGKAVTLAGKDGRALYSVNSYGNGLVFWLGKLLPNSFNLSNFAFRRESDEQLAFSNTTAGCSQLLLGEIAGYAAKQKYGYALRRIFGFYGAPSAAWEMHYEEEMGMAHGAMEKTDALCREYQQVPSFTLVRNTYKWYSRNESITYLLNGNEEGKVVPDTSFQLDIEEDAYSSGTHILAGDDWPRQDMVTNGGSYFGDYVGYRVRAYQTVEDYDSDGIPDILSGSADGKIRYYHGTGFVNGRFTTKKAVILTNSAGEELEIPAGYSAPCFADVDGDGLADIISGSGNGKLWVLKGSGSLSFEDPEELFDTGMRGQSLPRICDADQDGVADLAVGSDTGAMVLYYGEDKGGAILFSQERITDLASFLRDAGLGFWLAPFAWDINEDGITDFLIGTGDGNIAYMTGREEEDGGISYTFGGFLESEERNYTGSHRIKFGNWCVPTLADLNGDGAPDLVCGDMEYGLDYSIDSEHFPYREELQKDVDYAKAHFFYIGMHYYTIEYASAEREEYEIGRHLEALESYGIDTSHIGANQHTWHLTWDDDTQSLRELWNQGILWNSGFKPSRAEGEPPASAPEDVISFPFFLEQDGEKTIFLQNVSTMVYRDDWLKEYSVKVKMPVHAYVHTDSVFWTDDPDLSYLRDQMEKMSELRAEYGYNMCSEDKAIEASAAAYNLTVETSTDSEGVLTIIPGEESRDFKLYDEAVQKAVGLQIDFREDLRAEDYETDADVCYTEDGDLYVGMNKAVRVVPKDAGAGERPEDFLSDTPVERVNLPAEISRTASGTSEEIVLSFQASGMMQVITDTSVTTDQEEWTVTPLGDDKRMFTFYGEAAQLVLHADPE